MRLTESQSLDEMAPVVKCYSCGEAFLESPFITRKLDHSKDMRSSTKMVSPDFMGSTKMHNLSGRNTPIHKAEEK